MRHQNKGRKFGRERDERRAFLKSLAANLIIQGKIKTTEARAKEMRHLVERLITKSKQGDQESLRFAKKFLDDKTVNKLIKEVAPKFKERPGGYTRIIKLGSRSSDAAPMAIIELVE